MPKHHTGPTIRYKAPEIAGPTAVPRLKMLELSDIALPRLFLWTSSATSACRAGASTAATAPLKNESAIICQGLMMPLWVIVARTIPTIMARICVQIRIDLLE